MTWIEEAKTAILNSSETSSIYVGADSLKYKRKGQQFARFSTVVVLHLDSSHGCKVFHNTVTLPDYGNLKQRLMTEVSFAIAAASEIMDVMGDRRLEIHLDLNADAKHKSNVAVKEALGWVKGTLGIDASIKPHSWAASHCSDHVVRGNC